MDIPATTVHDTGAVDGVSGASPLTAFIADLRRQLPELQILIGDDCDDFAMDVMQWRGKAALVAMPSSVEDVQALVRLAYLYHIQLVPQGARTGLVGAAIPDMSGRQCVVSMRRMPKVISFDAPNRSITVGAGMPLSELNEFLAEHDLHFPIDLGSDPTIGGLIATNAGGSRLLKYGDVRHNVLGLKVVLADVHGTVLDMLRPLHKNSSGPDLKQLFIGTGGAMGIITSASLMLKQQERSRLATFMELPDYASVSAAMLAFESAFGEMLSAFEFIDVPAFHSVAAAFPDIVMPRIDVETRCLALVEIACSMPGLDALLEQRCTEVLQALCASGLVLNASFGAAERFWKIRDSLPLAVVKDATPLAFDVSFLRSVLPVFLADVDTWLASRHPDLKSYAFGHFGDGGCHLIVAIPHIALPSYSAMKQIALRSAIYDFVDKHGGSFSAEHGIGPSNIAYYRKFTSPPVRAVNGIVQSALDPRGLLGRCKY